jgi:hypothetical protein
VIRNDNVSKLWTSRKNMISRRQNVTLMKRQLSEQKGALPLFTYHRRREKHSLTSPGAVLSSLKEAANCITLASADLLVCHDLRDVSVFFPLRWTRRSEMQFLFSGYDALSHLFGKTWKTVNSLFPGPEAICLFTSCNLACISEIWPRVKSELHTPLSSEFAVIVQSH